MNELSIFCRNVYGHNAAKLDYVKNLCIAHNIVCVQEHLLTTDNFGLIQSIPDKSVHIHEAKRSSARGRPSGGLAIFVDDSIDCRKLESCDFYLAVEFPGPSAFTLVNVYLPTNMNTDLSEKRYAEACGRLGRLLRKLGNSRILVCGDFQCDPLLKGKLQDVLMTCIPSECTLYTKDQNFTFIHNSGSTSNIDHVFSNFTIPSPIQVDSEHTASDHLGLKFRVPFSRAVKSRNRGYIERREWKKINIDLYQSTCDEILGKIKVPFQLLVNGCDEKIALNTYCAEITHALKVAESASVPSAVIKKGTRKRGWSDHPYVNHAKRRSKMWYSVWRESGKPRSGTVFNLFRKTKREYKACVDELKVEEAETASKEAIRDPQNMWKKFSSSRVQPKHCATVPEEQWLEHYSKVFGSKNIPLEKEYDESLKSRLDSLLKQRNYFVVSKNNVSRAVSQLKGNKAPGLDSVSGNHLRNGSPLLLQHLQLLFQMCIDSATVPNSFCTGVVTNILKKGKNANECGGYRPITVSSTLSKVLERLVLSEIVSKCVIDHRQFGFRKYLSCAFAHRLLKRILAKAELLGLSVYVCSVDISAAFDSVIQSAVFQTLLDAGVNTHIVAMLSYWYSNSYIRVKLGLERLSAPVKLNRGLRQGSVLSPILFNTLTSKVTKQISGGLSLDLCDLSLISYADDLLMLSFSLSLLQDNLDKLVSGYRAIGLQVNGKKTEFLVFNSTKRDAPEPTVSVDSATIAPSSSLKYLGLLYGRDKKATRILCLDTLMSNLRISYAKLAPLKYSYNRQILARLYRAVALPHILYLSPVWEWFTETERLKARSAFCKYLKFLLRVPLFERNTFLLDKYLIPEPREVVVTQETNARKGALEHLYDFLPLHVMYEL